MSHLLLFPLQQLLRMQKVHYMRHAYLNTLSSFLQLKIKATLHGFMSSPPESKHTPFPTKAIQVSLSGLPL